MVQFSSPIWCAKANNKVPDPADGSYNVTF